MLQSDGFGHWGSYISVLNICCQICALCGESIAHLSLWFSLIVHLRFTVQVLYSS
jgi:hypothetical protein